jgi:hypothetical protein
VIFDHASHGPHGRRIPLFATTLHGESNYISVLWIGPSGAEFHRYPMDPMDSGDPFLALVNLF